MKCYTWEQGQLKPGIQVKRVGSRLITSLGEEGRGVGRYHEKVGFFPKNPPEIKGSAIFDAHPIKITTDLKLKRSKHYYVLAKPEEKFDNRFLVRINTKCVQAHPAWGLHGMWRTIKGTPEELAVGCGSQGGSSTIPRDATWHDGLVLFSPGDAVYIKPEGSYEIERYVLFCDDGHMHDLLLTDYRSKFASVIKEEPI